MGGRCEGGGNGSIQDQKKDVQGKISIFGIENNKSIGREKE
jgi:hypothetical protein